MIETIQNYPLSKDDLVALLSLTGEKEQALFDYSSSLKQKSVGNEVFLRGLIEISNICKKDCYYCGIRKSNNSIHRYSLNHKEVIEIVKQAYENGYGSVAIQSGELSSKSFINKIDTILIESKKITNNRIGITLSCGEQSEETFKRWFESGADRYLLRIETTSEELYRQLHPNDDLHSFSRRVEALESLRKINYQVGTGVMIGLPFQTTEILAKDLLFMKSLDIDMCGMGPYIEHPNTPLYQYREQLLPKDNRFEISLKMIALLRLLMPNINIAATTALQTLKIDGYERGLLAGANVVMPNITPTRYCKDYLLYENKPVSNRESEEQLALFERRIVAIDHKLCLFQQGNPKHYYLRNL